MLSDMAADARRDGDGRELQQTVQYVSESVVRWPRLVAGAAARQALVGGWLGESRNAHPER